MHSPFSSDASRLPAPYKFSVELSDISDEISQEIPVSGKRYFLTSDLRSRRGQRIQLVKIVLTTLIPILILLAETTYRVIKAKSESNRVKRVRSEVLFSLETGNVVHLLQIERGRTVLYIGSNGSSEVYDQLTKTYSLTDSVIGSLSKWPSSNGQQFRSREAFKSNISNFRSELIPWRADLDVNQAMGFYTDNNAIIIGWVADSIKKAEKGGIWQSLVAYHMLILSKEQAGIERALGGLFFAKGFFTHDELLWYTEKKALGEAYLTCSIQYSVTIRNLMFDLYKGSALETTMTSMRNLITENSIAGPSVPEGLDHFRNMTEYINILKRIQDSIGKDVVTLLDQESSQINREAILSIIMIILSVLLFPVIISLVFKLTKKLQRFAIDLQCKTTSLDLERKRSKILLYQLLPKSVAKELMQSRAVAPEEFTQVTIYFSDIVAFTTICSQSTPLEVVEMLGKVYETFDVILNKFDVYKVETIGDAYMVASGLPKRIGQNHVAEIAMFALEVLEAIKEFRIPHLPGQNIRIRTGIHSGSVVAGIVGQTMPRYCLFGDTVHVAARMESSGLPLKIQISDSANMALESFPGFITEERGIVNIKGCCPIMTYWLIGTNPGCRYIPRKHSHQPHAAINAFF